MKKLLLLPFILLLTNCIATSNYIFKLIPAEPIDEYYKGKALVSQANNKISCILNIEERDRGTYNFFVYVRNNSNTKYLVDPTQITAKYSDTGKFDDLNSTISVSVYDPEHEILKITKNLQDKEADLGNAKALSCCFAGTDIVTDLAGNFSKEPYDKKQQRRASQKERQEMEEKQQERLEKEILNLKDAKLYWQNELLRKTTLSKDQEIGGIVKIPVMLDKEFMRVTLNIADQSFDFNFKLLKISKSML